MFTKEIFNSIFASNKRKKFTISTNIATGRGINGVSYAEYDSNSVWNDDRIECHFFTEIVKVEDWGLVLKVDRKDYYCRKGKKTIEYVPFDVIVKIEFED